MKKQYTKVNENVYEAKENFVDRANEFYLAVSVDRFGREGVVAQIDFNYFPPTQKPLMGATDADKEAIMKEAQNCADSSGAKVRILKYTKVEVVAEFTPKNMN